MLLFSSFQGLAVNFRPHCCLVWPENHWLVSTVIGLFGCVDKDVM